MQQKEASIDVRVYYEDTDAGRIVYHSNYLNYAERGRTEFLRQAGFNHGQLAAEYSGVFVVKSCDINYKKPAYLDDLLSVRTRVISLRAVGMEMIQEVVRGQEMLTEINVVLVFVNADGGGVRKMPPELFKCFNDLLIN